MAIVKDFKIKFLFFYKKVINIVYLLLIFSLLYEIIYYCTKMRFFENNMYTLKYVKAGQAGKVLALSSKDISNKLFDKNAAEDVKEFYENLDKDVFVVTGESMAQERIHTEDILLVENTKISDLRFGDFIVLEIEGDKKRKVSTPGFKLRKYIMTIDLNESEDTLYQKLCEEDIETQFSKNGKEIFKRKYNEAKNERFEEKDLKTVILSITYTEEGKDYSFHIARNLYAKVRKILRLDVRNQYSIDNSILQ